MIRNLAKFQDIDSPSFHFFRSLMLGVPSTVLYKKVNTIGAHFKGSLYSCKWSLIIEKRREIFMVD